MNIILILWRMLALGLDICVMVDPATFAAWAIISICIGVWKIYKLIKTA